MYKVKSALIAFLLFNAVLLHAQTSSFIGIGAELGLPSGNFANVSAIGLGASLKADVALSNRMAITLNGGVMNFFGRHNQIINVADLTYLPAKAGLKYYLGEGFYAEGQFGAAFPVNDGQKTFFSWSPGLGTMLKIAGKTKLDLGIRYEGWTGKNDNSIVLNSSSNTKGFAGIRFAYLFGL